MLSREIRQRAQVFDARVVLHDRTRIHDIAAVFGHAVNDLPAVRANFIGFAVAEQDIRDAAAESELVMKFLVRQKNIALVHVEKNAALGQRGEVVEVMIPLALGVKQCLIPVRPKLRYGGRERRLVM